MKKWIWWLCGGILALGLVAITVVKQKGKRCQGVLIELDQTAEYPFFTQEDIQNMATLNGTDTFEEVLFEKINLQTVENRVLKNRLIKKCQAYRDLSGNLVIAIEQQKPVARLLAYSGSEQLLTASKGGYLTETGDLVPLSKRFAARVTLVSGSFFNNTKNTRSVYGQKLIGLLKEIQQEPLWKAQITELIVQPDGEITLIPQVGNYKIEFGLPEDSAKKLLKMRIFYTTILPLKGWERYKRVSLKYRNQIVCE
jgi:cell division protein FtsQ